MKLCKSCGEEIHPMRLEILPTATTCVKCSQEGKKAVRYSHKVDREDIETTLEFFSAEDYKRLLEVEKQYSNAKTPR